MTFFCFCFTLNNGSEQMKTNYYINKKNILTDKIVNDFFLKLNASVLARYEDCILVKIDDNFGIGVLDFNDYSCKNNLLSGASAFVNEEQLLNFQKQWRKLLNNSFKDYKQNFLLFLEEQKKQSMLDLN